MIATVIAMIPGGFTPARSKADNTPRITSIGAVSKIAMSFQKFEPLKRYTAKEGVSPESKYEKTRKPDARSTCDTADVIATRFQKSRWFTRKMLNHVST